MDAIGDFNIYQMNPVPVIGRSTFRYWLTESEITMYLTKYDAHEHSVQLRYPALFITHYFAQMRQAVYNPLKAIAHTGKSDKELRKIIIDFEKDYASKHDFEYMGIENKRRRESLLKNIKS